MRNILLFWMCFIAVSCISRNGKAVSTDETKDTTVLNTTKIITDTARTDIPNTTITETTAMDDLKLTKVSERFDRIKHDKIKDELGNSEYSLPDGSFVETAESEGEIWQGIIPKDSYFELVKIYYSPSGIIKTKGWSYAYRVNFPMGIWYEFNEFGEFQREENYDTPFKFSFDDILKFCQKDGIEVSRGYIPQSTGFHTTINRDVTDGKSWWEIERLIVRDKLFFIETIRLDGMTGKVISKTEVEYTNN